MLAPHFSPENPKGEILLVFSIILYYIGIINKRLYSFLPLKS